MVPSSLNTSLSVLECYHTGVYCESSTFSEFLFGVFLENVLVVVKVE
jgi:hypothetical protein